MEKPRTKWNGCASRKTKDNPIWAVCTKCGEERFTFAPAEGLEHYVCSSCRKKDEESVSMRCSRHRKRFNVPKSWLDTCWWLCPRCYEKLSEKERYKYMPMKMSATHDAEDGKPIIRPSTAVNGRMEGDDKIPERGISKTHKEEIVRPNVKIATQVGAETKGENPKDATKQRVHKPHEHYKPSKISCKPSLAALRPRYRIECMKCGEVFPCHYTWFDNSTVLCPSCYGKMTEDEIRMFHQSHHAEKPRYIPNNIPVQNGAAIRPIASSTCKVPSFTETKWTSDTNLVNSGGVWSKNRIMYSSREELIEAYRLGKVSKARCRIELRRRENPRFYDMLPDEVVSDASPYSQD